MAMRKMGLIYLLLVSIIGIIFGTLYIKLLPHSSISDISEQWGMIFQSDLTFRGSVHTMLTFLVHHLSFFIVMIIMGVTIIGYPVVILLHFIKAFIFGATIQLYLTLWDQIALQYLLIWVVPSAIIVLLVSIILTMSLGAYSYSIYTSIKSKHWLSPIAPLSKKIVVCILLLGVAALINSYGSPYIYELIIDH